MREAARAVRPDVDDLVAIELELLGRLARDLRSDERAVGQQQLDAHLEAEMDDALDRRRAEQLTMPVRS